MKNFRFKAPTEIFFGEGQVKQLPQALANFGKRVLLVYGGGSIKRNGVYQDVLAGLGDFTLFELGGVEPNPRIETVRAGINLCRSEQIEVILAVGGGSTIDCAKVIAAGVYYQGDAWDFTQDRSLVGKALPLVTVLTMAATGSEMNGGAVITNMATNEKLGTGGPSMIPRVSILDPSYTYTVPKWHTAAGSADIMSHLLENYFSINRDATLQDRLAEGIMKTVIRYTPMAIENPTDYEARANLMWASTWALNGLTGSGKEGVWSCHPIEHELSAYYDITHGIGLAIITPRWMTHVLNATTVDRFVTFAHNVWEIPITADKYTTAQKGIDALADAFRSWGVPATLAEVGVEQSKVTEMAEQAVKHSAISTKAFVPLCETDVVTILNNCF